MLLSLPLFASSQAFGQFPGYYVDITERYADAAVNIENRRERREILSLLLDEATRIDEEIASPLSAFAVARIRAGYATLLTSPFAMRRQLSLVKNSLERALEGDNLALNGLPQSYLGMLYLTAPGWPLSFGDAEKGKALLEQAIAIDSSNQANNYFYSYLFREDGDLEGALNQLQIAHALSNPYQNMPNLHKLLLREIRDDIGMIRQQLED